jgi:hypothetical protein
MAVLGKFLSVLLIVTALSAGVASPAAASAALPPAPALRCEDGICQLTGEASGVAEMLRTGTNKALKELPFEVSEDGALSATLDVNKDITLALPVGDVTLSNANLQIEVGPDGEIQRLRGMADMPFPTFGFLDDVRILTPARAAFGLERGENLRHRARAGSRHISSSTPTRPWMWLPARREMATTSRFIRPGQRTLVIDTVEPVAT